MRDRDLTQCAVSAVHSGPGRLRGGAADARVGGHHGADRVGAKPHLTAVGPAHGPGRQRSDGALGDEDDGSRGRGLLSDPETPEQEETRNLSEQ